MSISGKAVIAGRTFAGLAVDVGNPHLACVDPSLNMAGLTALAVLALGVPAWTVLRWLWIGGSAVCRSALGAGGAFTTVFDQAPYIEQSIESLLTEGLLGLAFAVVVILLFTAANAAAPAAWNDFISAGTVELSERGGIASLSGPFNHPVGLGTTMSLAFIAILAYRSTIRRSRISLALLIGSGLACLLAFRRKSIASALVVSLGIRASLPGKKAMYLTSLAILTPVALILGWDTLTRVVDATLTEYLSDVSQTARIRLTLDSVPLALGAFPLGVGFGRFASFTAAENYSPYYQELGYTRIWGMTGHDEVDFLSDTFWPAPLAETGILGALCYLGALIMFIVPGWRMMRSASAADTDTPVGARPPSSRSSRCGVTAMA